MTGQGNNIKERWDEDGGSSGLRAVPMGVLGDAGSGGVEGTAPNSARKAIKLVAFRFLFLVITQHAFKPIKKYSSTTAALLYGFKTDVNLHAN